MRRDKSLHRSRPYKTLSVRHDLHARFRRLLAVTGLQSDALLRRVLDLAERNVSMLTQVDPASILAPTGSD